MSSPGNSVYGARTAREESAVLLYYSPIGTLEAQEVALDSSGGGSGGGNGILGKVSEFSVMMLHNGAPWRHR